MLSMTPQEMRTWMGEVFESLSNVDPAMHSVALLHFAAGLELDEIAIILGIELSRAGALCRRSHEWLLNQLV